MMTFSDFKADTKLYPNDIESIRKIRKVICHNFVCHNLTTLHEYNDTYAFLPIAVQITKDAIPPMETKLATELLDFLEQLYTENKFFETLPQQTAHKYEQKLYSIYLRNIAKAKGAKIKELLNIGFYKEIVQDATKLLPERQQAFVAEFIGCYWSLLNSTGEIINSGNLLVGYRSDGIPNLIPNITPNPVVLSKIEQELAETGKTTLKTYQAAGIEPSSMLKKYIYFLPFIIGGISLIESGITALSSVASEELQAAYNQEFTVFPLADITKLQSAEPQSLVAEYFKFLNTLDTCRRRIISHKVTVYLENVLCVSSIEMYEIHAFESAYLAAFICTLKDNTRYICFLNGNTITPRLFAEYTEIPVRMKMMEQIFAKEVAKTTGPLLLPDAFIQGICITLYHMLISSTPWQKSEFAYPIDRVFSQSELINSTTPTCWFEDYLNYGPAEEPTINVMGNKYAYEIRTLEPYIRKLPAGQIRSNEADALAKSIGFILKPNETVVRGFNRNTRILATNLFDSKEDKENAQD